MAALSRARENGDGIAAQSGHPKASPTENGTLSTDANLVGGHALGLGRALFQRVSFGVAILGPLVKLLSQVIPFGGPKQVTAPVSHSSELSCVHRALLPARQGATRWDLAKAFPPSTSSR